MLKLDNTLFIGKGGDKFCYMHPENEGLCVKVPRDSHGLTVILKDLKSREKLKKRNADLSFAPRYFGAVETSLGLGYVYEMIRDVDGKISRSLSSYMRAENLAPADIEGIVQAMGAFKDFMFRNEVVVKDPKSDNFLMQKTRDGYVARYVDDLGSEVLIPLEYYISYFARLKLTRKWNHLINKTELCFTTPLAKRFTEELK